jgi:hypothetical protein
MKPKNLFILTILSLAFLAAGCQGVARTHDHHYPGSSATSSAIDDYRGPGIIEYDRLRLALSIGEPYSSLANPNDGEHH